MRKKKKVQIYKDGMKAGAKPFEKVYEKLAHEMKENSGKLDDIKSGQKRAQKITNDLINGQEELKYCVDELHESQSTHAKKIRNHQRKIDHLELAIPAMTTMCSNCGEPMAIHQLVCCKCGVISKVFPNELQGLNIEEGCYREVEKLSKVISDSCGKDEDWLYEELNEKLERMKKIREISKQAMNDKDGKNVTTYRKIYTLSQRFLKTAEMKKLKLQLLEP